MASLDQLDALLPPPPRCAGTSTISKRADVKVMLARDPIYCRCGSDQDGLNDAGLCGLDGAAQRGFVARIDDDRDRGRHLLGARDQAIVLFVRRMLARVDFGHRHFRNS